MEILTVRECADFLKVSQKTLYRYIREGLPYNQRYPHGKITFDKSKVIKWWEKYNHPYYRLYRRR
jgi:predicted site-specific integrase-resolvase